MRAVVIARHGPPEILEVQERPTQPGTRCPRRRRRALPDRLSFAEGAAIPINDATSWEALVRAANL